MPDKPTEAARELAMEVYPDVAGWEPAEVTEGRQEHREELASKVDRITKLPEKEAALRAVLPMLLDTHDVAIQIRAALAKGK